MSKNGYALIGWGVTKAAERIAKRKAHKNRGKLAAAAVVLLVVAAGITAAARDDEQ
jgi:hypothetical protein